MGLIDVYRINPADQFSVFSPSLKKTQEITYYTLLAKIRGDLNITSTSGNVDNWNQAYDQTIMSGVVTGYTTKTITLTRRDGTEISFDFQDLSPASEDTLDMVTTRGNSTVNIINVGGVSTPWLDLDTSYTGTTEVGRFSWDIDNATADLGLNDNVVLKIGQDDMWYVRNESGSAIPRGTAVMAVGTVGASGRILVSPMVANGSVAAKYLLGITSEEIADDADGYVLAKGNLREFNTSAYTAGQVLWCSPTTPGALTATEPAAPNLKLPIAFVVHADAVGMLAVRVTAGSTLSENNQVQFGTLANNDVLTYVSANGRWQNVPISTIASTLAFSTIAVTGQSSIVAETNQDTLNIASGTAISLTTNASTDTLTITNTAPDQIVSLTGTGTTTITGTYPNFTINSDDQYDGTVTSVALTAPSAFTVTGSPITTSGTIALGGAGTAAQYIRGDGQLGDFPTTSGGGSSVSYYLNGSINQGTFGGNVYREFSKTPIVGAGTDFSIAADGYIAQFITDVNDPSLLEIPGGNWNVEFWFSSSSSGGTPSFYVELSKYDGTTFTPIASNSATPEFIAFGTTISQYYTALAVPQTTLAVTDRLALRIYVIHSGRTITLHTEDNHLCQVITTFSTGLNALNGLTKQVQYFATGTSGTDFNISSVTDTHTFNLPTASSLNRGALSSADWITFNSKADFSFKTIAVAGQGSIVADAADDTLTVASGTGITLTTNSSTDTLTITNSAPDQTVVLTAGTGITTSGTYPSFTITNNDRGSSQNIFKNLAVSGQSTIVADNNDDTLTVASGTGISLTTNSVSDTFTITNTAPDQVVSITAGTGMSVSGTYPSFTVTNTAPDQVVSITGAGTSVVTGTYPNFTITSNDQYVGTVTSVNLTAGTGITVSGGPIISSGSITVNNNDRGSSQNIFKNIAVPGQTTIVASTNNDTFTVKPGSGISATTLGNDITISNTDTGSAQNIFKNIAVAGQNTIVADSNNDTLSFVAGTGISLTTNDTTDSLTVTNSAPDQVVALSSGTGISVSGTYPNFTITNTSPSSGGTVTGTGTTNYVTKWTTSSNIGDSQIFDNGTNVGIGTATPSQKLDVSGYITSQRYYPYSSGSTYIAGDTAGVTVEGSGYFYVFPSAGSYFQGIARFRGGISNDTASYLQINGGSSNVTYFNGTVGIGTTSPVAKLTTITNAAGWAGWIENQDTTGNGSGLVITGASNVGGISLLVRKQDGTSTMTVLGDGNVGIGTTSPTAALSISRGAGVNAYIEVAGNNNTIGTTSVVYGQDGSNNAYVWNRANAPVYFGTNNSTKMFLSASGNLGIGTTSPASLAGYIAETIDGTNGSFTEYRQNGTALFRIGADGSRPFLYGMTNAPMDFYTNNAQRMRITSDGNVGIGTTSPNEKLTVIGKVYARPYLPVVLSGNGSPEYGTNITMASDTGSTQGAVRIWSKYDGSGNAAMTFERATTTQVYNADPQLLTYSESMRISGNGNVGIGTTGPGAKLDVIGNARATTLSTTSGLGLNVGAYAYLSQTLSGVMTFLGHNVRASDSVANTAVVQNGGWVSSLIKMYYNEGITFHTDTTVYAAGATYPLATTERMRIQTNGNVGIGTSSAFSRLTVSGALTASSSQMSIVNTEGGHAIIRAGIAGISNNGISLVTANVDGSSQNVRMVVSATGNVGIGTTSPSASLHIAASGGVIFGATAGGVGTSQITTASAGSPVSSRFAFGTDGSGWQYRIAKNTAGTIADLVTVADSGNVGIGTTSPAYKLDVTGVGNFSNGFGVPSSETAYRLKFYDNGGTHNDVGIGLDGTAGGGEVMWFNALGGFYFGLGTNGTKVTISNTGNVGIGTTSPGSKLTVIGDIATSTRVASDTINGYTGGSTPLTIQTGGAQNLIIGTNNTERIRVTTAGDVGIGTTSPSAKLHVIGNATVSSTLSTVNAKITGTLTDYLNQPGTAGQILSSTGTGIEWITGGGGGGGSTIIVKDEGTTIGSSFTTLNFIGDNVNATASGSTAVIEVTGRASSGSVYYDDVANPFVIPGGGFANVEINTQPVMTTVPSSLTGSNKLMATITFGVSNVSLYEAFNGFKFRLYNAGPMSDVQGTTHSWNGFMSKDEGCTTTVFTFHIPIDPSVVAGGDTIVVQADALTNYTPEIYYCALTLIEGTN